MENNIMVKRRVLFVLMILVGLGTVSCSSHYSFDLDYPSEEVTQNADIVVKEHYVPVLSEAPAMIGSVAQLYLREVASSNMMSKLEAAEGSVVLFIHGAGTPAEVAFDAPYEGLSWMRYLAQHGFDTFSVDMTGYGRSTRPMAMNDRCNLSVEQQEQLFSASCAPSRLEAITTIASDWHDIDGVVDYLRELRSVDKVHLVGWSQGGPRAAGYAAEHPEKVANIVLLAPAYSRTLPATLAELAPLDGVMTKQSKTDFVNNWDRQVGCTDQYQRSASEAIWSAMLESDPVGASWGTGVRRAPRTPTFGWSQAEVRATQTPIMMVVGTHDAQVNPSRVRDFYADLGTTQKLYLEMNCSSHNAMWEKDATYLFDATVQWFTETSFNGVSNGMLQQ